MLRPLLERRRPVRDISPNRCRHRLAKRALFTLAILFAFPSIGVAQYSDNEPLAEWIRKAILAEQNIEIQFEDLERFGFPLYLLADLDEEFLTALRSEDAVTRRRAARAISLLGPSGEKYLDDLYAAAKRPLPPSPPIDPDTLFSSLIYHSAEEQALLDARARAREACAECIEAIATHLNQEDGGLERFATELDGTEFRGLFISKIVRPPFYEKRKRIVREMLSGNSEGWEQYAAWRALYKLSRDYGSLRGTDLEDIRQLIEDCLSSAPDKLREELEVFVTRPSSPGLQAGSRSD